jgi:excisionase family DNA binding protein
MTDKAFLTVQESAAIARCHPGTIRRAIRTKRLAAYKPGGSHGRTLVRTIDFTAWLERSRIAAVGETR